VLAAFEQIDLGPAAARRLRGQGHVGQFSRGVARVPLVAGLAGSLKSSGAQRCRQPGCPHFGSQRCSVFLGGRLRPRDVGRPRRLFACGQLADALQGDFPGRCDPAATEHGADGDSRNKHPHDTTLSTATDREAI